MNNPSRIATVSVGCCSMLQKRGQLPVTIIRHADKALYKAKHDGRNQVVNCDSTKRKPAARKSKKATAQKPAKR